MNSQKNIINTAFNAIYSNAGDVNKIVLRGGANNKKLVLNDNVFVLLVEDEITKPNLGIVIKHVLEVQDKTNEAVLVISKYIPNNVANELKQAGVNYLDISGNAYIKHKNLLIYIRGEKLVKLPKVKQTRAFQEVGIKMIFSFLNNPDIINKTYRQIAHLTGVSLASVGYVMKELEESNYLLVTEKKRLLKNKLDLLNRWIVAYHDVLRPRILKKRMRFIDDNTYKKWDIIQLKGREEVTQWGGEPAGALVTEFLKPEVYTIYTQANWQTVAKEFRLIPHEKGDVEVLDIFWNIENEQSEDPLVPILLVYSDLIGSGNDRNIQTAKRIFDDRLQYIK